MRAIRASLRLALRVKAAGDIGFLESVYQNVMFHQLRKAGLNVRSKVRLPVKYDGIIVGDFEADLIVENCVILEIKAGRAIDPSAVVQLVNYLRASEIEVGLVLNFGVTLEFRRQIFENSRKVGSAPIRE